jgi:hypothetical protein
MAMSVSNVLKFFRKSVKPVEMSPEDRAVILDFARGADELRKSAIAIHRCYIATIGVRGDCFQRFMAEVDNPAPDLYLRRVYREEVLAARAA